ncbi:hypothetical protein G5V58_07565 [Nocardioides anomalus]|uniref:SGNH hydrolase-type esterase domain-containing protein n=1 Tax=Nocardioides anomalus TaxID=2712223 RepID=A0A6G6WBQ0_9ACTN|nr:GDSL-type esterase/lipase family protein [Nocardioides anomalus]QIG42654.1 hypothetical protein G5V58_07565 [Nocardioides anomalus]
MRTSAASTTLAALVAVSGAFLAPPQGPAQAAAPEPVRILVVGDSITQGSSGDWTWRYRLWRHLVDHEVPVDLVGPRDDLWDYLDNVPGDQRYADPAFDRDHAARWGMALQQLDAQLAPVEQLVSDHHPDVVVELLGSNDLAFLGRTPQQVAEDLADFVADARSADPGVDVVLGRVPQPWREEVAALNDLLPDLAEELDTPGSRVVVADSDAGVELTPDTLDGAHPNAHGELKIAAGVADALHELGIGPAADRPLVDVPRGPVIAPVLSAEPGEHRATLSWVRSPGSGSSEVWQRDLTAGGSWRRIEPAAPGTAYLALGLAGGHRFEFQTRPLKGFWIAESPSGWSNVVRVDLPADPVPQPPAPPPVETVPRPGAVTHVSAVAKRDGRVRTTGRRVSGAASYTLLVATVGRCRATPPPSARFLVNGSDLPAPRRTLHADARAVWVRWVAVRDGAEGPATARSSACAVVRR